MLKACRMYFCPTASATTWSLSLTQLCHYRGHVASCVVINWGWCHIETLPSVLLVSLLTVTWDMSSAWLIVFHSLQRMGFRERGRREKRSATRGAVRRSCTLEFFLVADGLPGQHYPVSSVQFWLLLKPHVNKQTHVQLLIQVWLQHV